MHSTSILRTTNTTLGTSPRRKTEMATTFRKTTRGTENGALVMKNMTRKLFCEVPLLCLMMASSGHLFAQSNGQQSAEAILKPVSRTAAATSNAAPTAPSEPEVRVGPGDLLDVRVFDVPEL